jgi:hypothetical protein
MTGERATISWFVNTLESELTPAESGVTINLARMAAVRHIKFLAAGLTSKRSR